MKYQSNAKISTKLSGGSYSSRDEIISPQNEKAVSSKGLSSKNLAVQPDFYVTIRNSIENELPELLVNIGSSYNSEIARKLNRKLQGY